MRESGEDDKEDIDEDLGVDNDSKPAANGELYGLTGRACVRLMLPLHPSLVPWVSLTSAIYPFHLVYVFSYL